MKVVSRSKDKNCEIKGSHEPYTVLNTLIYNIKFPNGNVKEHSHNFIAKNMHDQAHNDGHATQILDAIVDQERHK